MKQQYYFLIQDTQEVIPTPAKYTSIVEAYNDLRDEIDHYTHDYAYILVSSENLKTLIGNVQHRLIHDNN